MTEASRAREKKYRDSAKGRRYAVTKRRRIAVSWRVPLRDWLKEQPCMDCGIRFHPAAMEFDHRPGTIKRREAGKLFRVSLSLGYIQEELMKCDLVCANCHRVRTETRRMGT